MFRVIEKAVVRSSLKKYDPDPDTQKYMNKYGDVIFRFRIVVEVLVQNQKHKDLNNKKNSK